MESKEEDLLGRELLVQEFSWDDQGFCVMSNFYSDIAVLLDDKFRLAHSLIDTMEENKEQENKEQENTTTSKNKEQENKEQKAEAAPEGQ